MARKYKKGYFRPTKPEKYKGNPTNIEYRSGWERTCMVMFDTNDNVLEWASEETIVPYRSPIDNRTHRYFVDFLIKVKDKNGNIRSILIEVKPDAQTRPPAIKSKTGKPTKRYLNEVQTWGVNSAKWAAARAYCQQRGYEFQILTEHDIYPGKK